METIAPDCLALNARPAWLPEGPCAELIARLDWSATPLGPIDRWPASLRTVLAILLRSPAPMVLLWREEGTMLLNDATAAVMGDSLPQAIGRSVFQSLQA